MDLCQTRRGRMQKMDYLSSDRVELIYELPLAEVVLDFFDVLKSRTKGYASLDYEPAGTQTGQPRQGRCSSRRPACSTPSLRSCTARKADDYGRKMTAKLREPSPRQLFDVSIQAAIGDASSPGDCEGQAQGRPRQVLRAAHHAKAQAPREAEGGQEADEVHRARRDPPGGCSSVR